VKKRDRDAERRARVADALDLLVERMTRTEVGTSALLAGVALATATGATEAVKLGYDVPPWVEHPGRAALLVAYRALPWTGGLSTATVRFATWARSLGSDIPPG